MRIPAAYGGKSAQRLNRVGRFDVKTVRMDLFRRVNAQTARRAVIHGGSDFAGIIRMERDKQTARKNRSGIGADGVNHGSITGKTAQYAARV